MPKSRCAPSINRNYLKPGYYLGIHEWQEEKLLELYCPSQHALLIALHDDIGAATSGFSAWPACPAFEGDDEDSLFLPVPILAIFDDG